MQRNMHDLNYEFVVGSYSETHPISKMDAAAKIYLLDYSLPIDLIDKYFNKLVWIDHHVSAIEKTKQIQKRSLK